MVSLVLGLVAFIGTNKEVVLAVDGQASSVQTFGSTVSEVLESAQVRVDGGDEVSPALSSDVSDGARIEVRTAKEVRVNLNGAERTVQTTGTTVGELVNELGVEEKSDVSKPFTMQLASSGTHVAISTPKAVKILVDGKSHSLETTASTVAEAIAEAEVKIGPDDRVSVAQDAPPVDGMAVRITRVDTSGAETIEEAIPFETVTEEDNGLYEDQRKVTQEGADGTFEKTYALVRIDGEEAGRTLTSEKIIAEPVSEKIAVGTKERPEPEPEPEPETKPEPKSSSSSGTTAAGPSSGAWQALAECESGGNWAINTGNGYYGGLQFSVNSWLGAGGGNYAPYPHEATPAEQIATAKVLKQSGGWGHWPSCSAQLGLG